MKQKDIKEVKTLNKELRKVTERYSLIINDDSSITLWDNSYEKGKIVFKTIEIFYVRTFVEGFILGRNTQG